MKSISKEAMIISGIGIVFLIVMGVLISRSSSFTAPNSVTGDKQAFLVRSDSHMTGSSTAKVVMVEFGDYECPACGSVYLSLKQISDMYQGNPDFTFVFRNFPLSQHQNAKISAEAAEAAGAQGKYWEMHDALYEGQSEWDPSKTKDPLSIFAGYAEKIGLDVSRFREDVENNAFQDKINADLADVSKLGLNHTPTVFINGTEQTDLSTAVMKAKIDTLLAE